MNKIVSVITAREIQHIARITELEAEVARLKAGIHPAKKPMAGGFSMDKFMADVQPEDAAALGDFLDQMEQERDTAYVRGCEVSKKAWRRDATEAALRWAWEDNNASDASNSEWISRGLAALLGEGE